MVATNAFDEIIDSFLFDKNSYFLNDLQKMI